MSCVSVSCVPVSCVPVSCVPVSCVSVSCVSALGNDPTGMALERRIKSGCLIPTVLSVSYIAELTFRNGILWNYGIFQAKEEALPPSVGQTLLGKFA